jgi:hypothetical protein
MTFVVIDLYSGSRRHWPQLRGKLKKVKKKKNTT